MEVDSSRWVYIISLRSLSAGCSYTRGPQKGTGSSDTCARRKDCSGQGSLLASTACSVSCIQRESSITFLALLDWKLTMWMVELKCSRSFVIKVLGGFFVKREMSTFVGDWVRRSLEVRCHFFFFFSEPYFKF